MIITTHEIYCDNPEHNPDCDNEKGIDRKASFDPTCDIYDLRENTEAIGWAFTLVKGSNKGLHDLCPSCYEKLKEKGKVR